jgi:hypothetical protein
MLKKRKKINFFLVILLLMSAVACRKDKPQPCFEPNGIECLDFKELSELASVLESQLKQQTDYRPELDRLIEHIAHLLAQRGR